MSLPSRSVAGIRELDVVFLSLLVRSEPRRPFGVGEGIFSRILFLLNALFTSRRFFFPETSRHRLPRCSQVSMFFLNQCSLFPPRSFRVPGRDSSDLTPS